MVMVSTDVNAVKSVLTLLNLDNWNEDMPRLVRGAIGRQHKGRWGTTIANAWGVLGPRKILAEIRINTCNRKNCCLAYTAYEIRRLVGGIQRRQHDV